jgi:hypothetical protein
MTEYFIIVNRTKQEFINPCTFGDGLQWEQMCGARFGGLSAMALLLRANKPGESNDIVGRWIGDDVAVLGEYADAELFDDAVVSWNDISFKVLRIMAVHPDVRDWLRVRLAVRRKVWATPEEEQIYKEVLDNV